jgi:DNA-binding IclR family transcriptional regulator
LPYAQPCARIRNDGTFVSRTRQPSSRRIGSAERAIALLDVLAETSELGTNELARRTGMTPSTVSRQLGTLAASGLVERVPASGRYRLGLRIVQLANALLARLDVRAVARPHLEALVQETGETATLSVPGEEDAVTIDFV